MDNDSPAENNLLKSELPLPDPNPISPDPLASIPSPSETPSSEFSPDPSNLAKSRLENVELPDVVAEIEKPRSKKPLIIALSSIIILLISGLLVFYFLFYSKQGSKTELSADETSANSASEKTKKSDSYSQKFKISDDSEKLYSRLSGEEISSASEDSAPTYCVQIPNGVDGARNQIGLSEAKIVFEAIAESGITRFAAIFQNPPAVIGPIRSLRIYYLNWDVPFDCTVVHAGGSAEALNAISSYGVRDLDESDVYMWRANALYPDGQTTNRLWNNLFTSSDNLTSFNESRGFYTSDIKSFPRMTPSAAEHAKITAQISEQLKIDIPASGDTSVLTPKVTHFSFTFGNMPTFNPVFDYDPNTNSYLRSYETGAPHEVFLCESENSCELRQLSPSVVIAMFVQEKRASYDGYHEDITVIGAGDVYIFQNGDVILGTWEKSSKNEQIIFRDSSGAEISLIPGQTWISAIPNYGSVSY